MHGDRVCACTDMRMRIGASLQGPDPARAVLCTMRWITCWIGRLDRLIHRALNRPQAMVGKLLHHRGVVMATCSLTNHPDVMQRAAARSQPAQPQLLKNTGPLARRAG